MSDINIAFCRRMLKSIHADVREHFPAIKVSEAAVLDSGFGQYFFEYMDEGEPFRVYVKAQNAYEARYEGWGKFLGHKKVEGWT
jgi:hypothetical protein